MPIYNYQCESCDYKIEVIQKFSDNPKRKCPECGRLKLKRLFGVPGLKFIGSGFYVNDYGSGSQVK